MPVQFGGDWLLMLLLEIFHMGGDFPQFLPLLLAIMCDKLLLGELKTVRTNTLSSMLHCQVSHNIRRVGIRMGKARNDPVQIRLLSCINLLLIFDHLLTT